jgi:hypothetical protein
MSSEAADNWYILVTGLRASEPMALASGLSLRPLESPLSVFDLAAAGAVGFRGWAVLEPVTSTCTCEIESAEDAAVSSGYDALNRAWLASVLLSLRGYNNHLCVACSRYSWRLIAGHQKRTSHVFHEQLAEEGPDAAVHRSRRDLPRFTGDLLDFQLKLLTVPVAKREPVAPEDAAWIGEHFVTFDKLAAQSTSFRLALEASIDWRYAKDRRSAVARIWAGVEAVFGISSELVYRISVMSASLLTPRGQERRKKFEDVKKLYGLRSKAVHGSDISDDKLGEALDGSYRLLADLLLLMVNQGRVLSDRDFEAALFD